MGACASRQSDAEVEALEGQLAAARAAARHAERQAAEAEQRAKQHESKALALELERRQLAGQVVELQRQLEEAGGRVQLAQNGSATPPAVAEQRQGELDGPVGQQEAGLAAENEQLRNELSQLRTQLEAVLRENGELAERLMQVAFEQPPAPLDTPYKVERRSSKVHTTAAAAAAAAAADEQLGGEMGRNGSGQRWLDSP